MAINRFDQPVAIRSRFIPKEFTPNFNAYQELLKQEQGTFDQAKALQDTPIDALQGADEQYAQELRKELMGKVDSITEAYGTNVDEGRRASRDFIRDTKRRTLPGGDIRELAARKKAFTDYQAEQSKRLQEGKIRPEQYWASVQQAKEKYDAAGGYKGEATLGLNARTEAVNFNDFANTFLKNFTANSNGSYGNMRVEPTTGKLIYDKTKVTELQARKIQQDLTAAYRNEASQTGQLDDLFDYRNKDGEMVIDRRDEAKAVMDQINQLDLNDKTQATQAQELLNSLGANLEPDGVAGQKTQEAIDNFTSYSNQTDNQLRQASKDGFLDNYINQLAAPYSDAKSSKQVERDLGNLGRTLDAEFDLTARKKKLDDIPFMFDGNSITMNYGSLAEGGITDLNQSVQAQSLKINELNLAKSKALVSGDVNSMNEVDKIETKIKWEEGKLQELKKLQQSAYTEATNKYGSETMQLIDEINNNSDAQIAQGSGIGSQQMVQRELRRLAEKTGVPYEKYKEAYDVAQVINNEASKILERNLEQGSQVTFNTLAGLPDNVTKAVEGQLQVMAFDFYDENGPVQREGEGGWFSKGDTPITPGKVKVRGVTKSAWGDNGHLFTLENTETGDIFYGAPRNSSLSTRLGIELEQYVGDDPELQKVAFNLQHTQDISSQTAGLRNNIPGVVTVGDKQIPVTKTTTAYGTKYQLTVPGAVNEDGNPVTYGADNNEELNDYIYIISTHGKDNK